jgi:hypothetical protein
MMTPLGICGCEWVVPDSITLRRLDQAIPRKEAGPVRATGMRAAGCCLGAHIVVAGLVPAIHAF